MTMSSYHKILPCFTSILLAISLSACQQSPNQAMDVPTVATASTTASTTASVAASSPAPTLKANVSQQFIGASLVQQRLKQALPEIAYTTDNLPMVAQQVNQVSWSPTGAIELKAMPASAVAASQAASTASASATQSTPGFQSTIDYAALKQSANDNPSSVANKDALPSKQVFIKPDELLVFKTQALLNWHGHSVGALTGIMNKNTIKAMQIFQQKHNLPVTTTMDEATWSALTSNETLNKQPIFINYQLTRDDLVITKAPKDMQYKSAREAVAEKFHMSQKLVSRLNPTTPLKAGNIITVYNPYQPNMTEVTKVVSDKKKIFYTPILLMVSSLQATQQPWVRTTPPHRLAV